MRSCVLVKCFRMGALSPRSSSSSIHRFFVGPSTSLASQTSLDIIRESDGESSSPPPGCCRSVASSTSSSSSSHRRRRQQQQQRQRLFQQQRCCKSQCSAARCGRDARNRNEYEDLSIIDKQPSLKRNRRQQRNSDGGSINDINDANDDDNADVDENVAATAKRNNNDSSNGNSRSYGTVGVHKVFSQLSGLIVKCSQIHMANTRSN